MRIEFSINRPYSIYNYINWTIQTNSFAYLHLLDHSILNLYTLLQQKTIKHVKYSSTKHIIALHGLNCSTQLCVHVVDAQLQHVPSMHTSHNFNTLPVCYVSYLDQFFLHCVFLFMYHCQLSEKGILIHV